MGFNLRGFVKIRAWIPACAGMTVGLKSVLVSIADLRGDKFIQGAMSALVSKIGSFATRGMDPTSIQRTAIIASLGGLSSKATGGDFVQGAMTAVIVHLYNERTGNDGCPGCVQVTLSNGSKGWVPQSVMNSGFIMADQTNAESLSAYNETTQSDLATGFSVIGFLTTPYWLISGASAMGAYILDSESISNLIGVVMLPAAFFGKFLDEAFYYGGKGFEGVFDTISTTNDTVDYINTIKIDEGSNK